MTIVSERPACLPELCYSVHPINPNQTIIVVYGSHGYTPAELCPGPEHARKHVESMNRALKVTPQQHAAMVSGSMFGWHIPAAHPNSYDDNGKPRPCEKR